MAVRFAWSLLLLLLAGCATFAPPGPSFVARTGVAFDRAGELGAFAEGLADPATRRAVTPDDPVRVASVSKLVVAIGVLRMVEDGALDLDRPVGDYLGYPVANPAFPGQPVTLRRLLSHTASLRDHDDQYAIPLGGSIRAVLADPASWDAGHGPDAGYFTYSNLNFPLIASIVEAVTDTRFDHMMKLLVLDPLRLDACFNWPLCSDAAVAHAVVLTQNGKPVKDDLGGKRPACPVQAAADGSCDLNRWRAGENGALMAPQGGLRISARGLARIGRMLLNNGTLDGQRILKPASVDLLLKPVWAYDGTNGDTDGGFYCRYGLASQTLATARAGCADDPAGDGTPRVGHAGEAYGLRSGLWIDRAAGRGVAYLVTGLDDPQAKGRSAFRAAEEDAFGMSVARLQRRP